MALLIRRLAVATVAAWLAVPGAVAQSPDAEYQLKAAFLYHFGTFVEWREDALPRAGESFTIGVVGADPLANYLLTLTRGRTLHGRPIEVRPMRADARLDDVQMVFVGRAAIRDFARIAERTADRPVLLVSDVPGGIAVGGGIDFVVEEDRVRFDVALDRLHRRGLRASSRMLDVARRVVGEP